MCTGTQRVHLECKHGIMAHRPSLSLYIYIYIHIYYMYIYIYIHTYIYIDMVHFLGPNSIVTRILAQQLYMVQFVGPNSIVTLNGPFGYVKNPHPTSAPVCQESYLL